MSQQIDLELCDRMINRVAESERPLSWRTGPYSDRVIKQRFGLRGYHQSVVCAHLKYLVEAGLVRVEETGDEAVVIMGDHIRGYPIVQALPA